MELQEVKNKGIAGVLWGVLGKLSTHIITFIVTVILARLLAPSDFGLVAMAMIFVYFTQTFMDFGLTSAVIQKKDPTETQINTVFIISMVLATCLMLIMIIIAPFIGKYYNNPEVTKIARFVSYSFVIYALTGIQRALFSKQLNIKFLTVVNMSGAFVQGISGVLLAIYGYGAWSIVYSVFLGNVVSTVMLWIKSSWRPKWLFNLHEIKDMFTFGFKMFIAGVLNSIYAKIDELIIGKIFNATTLGYYSRSKTFNNLITSYTSEGLSSIFFPIMSHLQNEMEKAKTVIIKSLEIISFIAFGLVGLLYLDAEPLIVLIFGAKWEPSVEYFKILAFIGYAYPVSVILVNVLTGLGESGKFLILEIWKKGIGLAGLAVGFVWGMNGFLWAMVITGTIGVMLNMRYVQIITDLKFSKQFFVLVKYAILAFISAFIVWFINLYLPHNLWLLLAVNTILFTGLYLLYNFALKTNGFLYVKDIFINKLLKKIMGK